MGPQEGAKTEQIAWPSDVPGRGQTAMIPGDVQRREWLIDDSPVRLASFVSLLTSFSRRNLACRQLCLMIALLELS